MDEARIRLLLEPFGLNPSDHQSAQISTYLELLLRWNQKINLTAIRDPGACVTRHFGESLFLAEHLQIHGSLLDIGSGAGFPGLAMKIAFPQLAVTLLEPVAKKRAFLKEAARVCGLNNVSVQGDRLEDFATKLPALTFEFATMRAVGHLENMLPLAARSLNPGGSMLLWLTREQTETLSIPGGITWTETFPIPLSRDAIVLRAVKAA